MAAETVGFEPTVPRKGYSTLAGWCTKPNYATSPGDRRNGVQMSSYTASGGPPNAEYGRQNAFEQV